MTLRVRIFPADRSGCGHYRCIYPAAAVEALGLADLELQWVFEPDDPLSLELKLTGTPGNVRVVGVTDPECDVVVLQRPAHRQLAEAIPFIQEHGTAVVCEYDDDFDSIDERNPSFRAYSPAHSPDLNSFWAKMSAQLCDLVTVSTPALVRRYGTHGRFTLLPNYVPAAHLDAKPLPGFDRDWLKLGYAGNPAVHPGDLEMTGDAVPRLVSEGFGFLGIGGPGVLSNLGLAADESRVEVMGGVPIEQYASALATLDVGIVPLRDTTFNRAKSWLKGLEYAAVGVPFIASPTDAYKELARLGVGDVVNTTTCSPASWVRALTPLLEDETWRKLRAEESRIQVGEMTYEKHARLWLQAWSDALTIRRADV